jgi:hypothetical protein
MAPGSDSMSSTTPQREDGFDLLCALAGAELAPERIERIANWNLSALDWSEILRLAEHHGVLPLAARNLIEHGRGLPPEIERSLRSAYEANLRRNLWFTAELARIMQHFERRQARAVPYKGPALAQSLYHDPGLRSFSDLDFLISSTDFEPAKQALAEIGYRPSADLLPAVERLWLRTGYERSFDGAAGKNLVELQWALLPHFYGVDLGVEDLLARRPHGYGRVRNALPVSRRFGVGAVSARRQASLDAADLAFGHCGDLTNPDHRLLAGVFPGACSGKRSYSRRKFLAGEERASGGASQARGGNDCGRSSGAGSWQRIRRASRSRCGLRFRIHGILPPDPETA